MAFKTSQTREDPKADNKYANAATTDRIVNMGLGKMIRKKRVRVGEKARRAVPIVRLGDVMVDSRDLSMRY